ncbi:MAG: hypothetical protein AMXMBFR49_18740 [Chlorobiota bacterium]|nr:MAG: cytochrome C [Chlorobiota bacterium]
MRKIFPQSLYNPISVAGAALAALSFGLIIFLIIVETFSEVHKPYMGILTFIIMPVFLIAGLLIIAYGWYREHKLSKRIDFKARKFPTLDLNDPKQLRAVMFFSVGTIILLVFSAFGSFKAYEYTDSDEFCGTVCHEVMEPEYTAYQNSPHSKVGCVSCHIGSGADWFVRAKISGSYQLYSVTFNKFSRPIPTPIENLRPAQETCEQCHWPKHFFSEKKVDLDYYLADEANTKASLTLLMRVGGGNSEIGNTEGIHWHMNLANDIYYEATDHTRQTIPWVKAVNKATGKETVYRMKGYTKKVNEKGEDIKKMDCIDCHNRPAHIYNEPSRIINITMSNGKIASDLPYIKSITTQALDGEYATKEEARLGIAKKITDFYRNTYPDIAKSRAKDIANAVKEIQVIYSKNYFPEMKVSWRKYPNHLGHMNYDGCFRCHDGNHVSDDGKVITNDCNSCHILLEETTPQKGQQISSKGLEFTHPGGIEVSFKTQKCSACHGVGNKTLDKKVASK